jgi:hypothetical protein
VRKKPGSEPGSATLFGGEKTTQTNKLEVKLLLLVLHMYKSPESYKDEDEQSLDLLLDLHMIKTRSV